MLPRIAGVVAHQAGLITREQALRLGMSVSAIRHALREAGPWHVVVSGVYTIVPGPWDDHLRIRAALLHAGPRALLTGLQACRLHGLHYLPGAHTAGLVAGLAVRPVDVLVEHRRGVGTTGFVRVIRSTRLPNGQVWCAVGPTGHTCGRAASCGRDAAVALRRVGSVPVVPPPRAVLDAVTAAVPSSSGVRPWTLREVRALMCEVVQRRRASVAQLDRELKARNRRGTALATTVMADLVAGVRSAPEAELRDLTQRSTVLPEPLWNQPLLEGMDLIPDACWPEARLIVEVDSRSWHGFGNAPADTERRRAQLASLGWRVLPVSPARLRSEPAVVLAEIETAYLAGVGAR